MLNLEDARARLEAMPARDALHEGMLRAVRTALPQCSLPYLGLGLAEEAGEGAGKIKKLLRDSSGIITPEWLELMQLELGDVWWYWSMLHAMLDLDPHETIQKNQKKLADRAARGVLGGSGDRR